MNDTASTATVSMTRALSFLGVVLGIFVSAGVLMGDEQGRVNLLFLLLLFAFLPIFSLCLSLLLLTTKQDGLTAFILDLPFWPRRYRQAQRSIELHQHRRSWLFYESQVLSLAFAAGSILVFIALLLGTDVNFVWRSTLLEAPDILPILQIIAFPWRFWETGQPTLALLEASQGSRILSGEIAYSQQWWPFVFASQLTYSFLPRAVLLCAARWKYHRNETIPRKPLPGNAASTSNAHKPATNEHSLAPVVNALSDPYQLLDWGHAPPHCHALIASAYGPASGEFALTPESDIKQLMARNPGDAGVILVKSWEPPLGELRDILTSLDDGIEWFLLPLDWDETTVKPATDTHLQEWRRFAASLGSHKVLQPVDEP